MWVQPPGREDPPEEGMWVQPPGREDPPEEGMWVQSLGREDPPEEGTATHSSIQRSLAGYSPRGHAELDTTE